MCTMHRGEEDRALTLDNDRTSRGAMVRGGISCCV